MQYKDIKFQTSYHEHGGTTVDSIQWLLTVLQTERRGSWKL